MWNCLWGHALKRSPGIIRKSRVSYPGSGFLSSATWPSMPKRHYNGLNETNLHIITLLCIVWLGFLHIDVMKISMFIYVMFILAINIIFSLKIYKF